MLFTTIPLLLICAGAVNSPLLGLYCNLVEDTYVVLTVPVVASANNGYRVAFVVVSSDMVTELPPVAQVNADPLHVSAVLAVVGATMNEVAPAPV